MRKWEKIQIVKNVGSGWVALAINVLVGILLWPFILHRLGDAASGVWVLIFSITGYYGLFDLGIRSSIVRYVSKFSATDNKEEIAKLINTSLFSYSCIGALCMLVTIVGCLYVSSKFRVLHILAEFCILTHLGIYLICSPGTERWSFCSSFQVCCNSGAVSVDKDAIR